MSLVRIRWWLVDFCLERSDVWVGRLDKAVCFCIVLMGARELLRGSTLAERTHCALWTMCPCLLSTFVPPPPAISTGVSPVGAWGSPCSWWRRWWWSIPSPPGLVPRASTCGVD